MKMYLFLVSLFLSYIFTLHLKGKCKNLAHPAITAIIVEFFYSDKDSLAALYPQDFERAVPDHAIALVMTVVSTSYFYQTTSTNNSFIDSELS